MSLGTSERWARELLAGNGHGVGSEVPQRGRCGSGWGIPRTRGERTGERGGRRVVYVCLCAVPSVRECDEVVAGGGTGPRGGREKDPWEEGF